MTHSTSPEFWHHFNRLPQDVQDLARKKFDLLKSNPMHPSLHFKQIEHFWSVRVGLYYRALGLDVDDGVIWFWIGCHPEYDRIIGCPRSEGESSFSAKTLVQEPKGFERESAKRLLL